MAMAIVVCSMHTHYATVNQFYNLNGGGGSILFLNLGTDTIHVPIQYRTVYRTDIPRTRGRIRIHYVYLPPVYLSTNYKPITGFNTTFGHSSVDTLLTSSTSFFTAGPALRHSTVCVSYASSSSLAFVIATMLNRSSSTSWPMKMALTPIYNCHWALPPPSQPSLLPSCCTSCRGSSDQENMRNGVIV